MFQHGRMRAIEGSTTMLEHEVRIRIAGEGLAFVYSIYRAGELVETAEVLAGVDPIADPVPDQYYGGSQVMD